MKRMCWLLICVGTLSPGFDVPLRAQSPTSGDGALHFVAEFAGDVTENDRSLTLTITFHGDRPTPTQTEKALRNCLKAAVAIHGGKDIAANAWHVGSSSAAEREPLTLSDGAEGLVFVAKDQTTRFLVNGAVSASAGAAEPDNLSAVAEDAGVKSACESAAKEQLSSLIVAASGESGRERKHILKAMRTWCKENGVSADRALRRCMSAISKAVVATGKSHSDAPVDLAAAISRGATEFVNQGCAKCHQSNGGGGRRGPSLIDSQWDHCDGSIKGIRAVIVSGVPKNKLKDASRPSGMNPTGGPGTTDQDLSDLAAYVQSLSQN